MLLGSYSNPRQVFTRYEVLGFISSGTYGRVYKARYRDGRPGEFAIKKFKTDHDGEMNYTGLTQSAIREMSLCSELSHTNVVRTAEIILEDKAVYIVFEYAEHDLLQIIHHHSQVMMRAPIPVMMVKSILFQLIQGVLYLHRSWVLHRDLKPANIMISGGGSIKVGDLGLARNFRRPLASLYAGDKVVVTIWYRAPELLLGARHYTPAIDLWSIGCIFAELLSLRPIFKGEEAKMEGKKVLPFQKHQMQKIIEVMGVPLPEHWPLLVQMPEYYSFQQLIQTLTQTRSSASASAGAIPPTPTTSVDIRNVSIEKWFYSTLASRYVLPPSSSFAYVPGNMEPSVNTTLNSHALSLLKGLLDFNPETRLTAEQALFHPFFTDDQFFEANPVGQRNCFYTLASGVNDYPARRVSPDDLESQTVALQVRQAQAEAVTHAATKRQPRPPTSQAQVQAQSNQGRIPGSQLNRHTQLQSSASVSSQYTDKAPPQTQTQSGQDHLQVPHPTAGRSQVQQKDGRSATIGSKRPYPGSGGDSGNANLSATSILDMAYQKAAKRRREG